jgi:hypothetical protein
MSVALEESTGYYTALSKITGQELKLAMQRLWLTGKVTPFGGRLLVEHTFQSAESKPVEAVYAFMLPQDAALRSFRVTGEGFEITSDLQPVEEAVATYEKGIDAGSLAVLARQYSDGMMNLTVGNLQPGETVRVILEILAGVERHDDGFRLRFPFTLAPAYHRQAKAVALPDGGEMELPRGEFGDLMLPTWKRDAARLHQVGFDLEGVWPGPRRGRCRRSWPPHVSASPTTRARGASCSSSIARARCRVRPSSRPRRPSKPASRR